MTDPFSAIYDVEQKRRDVSSLLYGGSTGKEMLRQSGTQGLLSDREAQDIRQEWRMGDSTRVLARRYGVSQSSICNVLHFRSHRETNGVRQ